VREVRLFVDLRPPEYIDFIRASEPLTAKKKGLEGRKHRQYTAGRDDRMIWNLQWLFESSCKNGRVRDQNDSSQMSVKKKKGKEPDEEEPNVPKKKNNRLLKT